MKAILAAVVVPLVAAVVVLVVAGDSTAGKGIALTLFGVACVLAVSGVFWAVGRSEDEERAAAEAARKPDAPEEPHPRPALDRRRPMPPRRPS